MKKWMLLFSIVAFVGTSVGFAQSPKPGPEMKKLSAWNGEWTYEGEAKESALGPAGKFSGKVTCHMTLGGFFLDCRWEEKGPLGSIHGIEIDGYDPINKKFTTHSFGSDGSQGAGSIAVDGNRWTYLIDVIQSGKQAKARATAEFSSDGMGFSGKSEISLDGKSWTLLGESKGTKSPPRPKASVEAK